MASLSFPSRDCTNTSARTTRPAVLQSETVPRHRPTSPVVVRTSPVARTSPSPRRGHRHRHTHRRRVRGPRAPAGARAPAFSCSDMGVCHRGAPCDKPSLRAPPPSHPRHHRPCLPRPGFLNGHTGFVHWAMDERATGAQGRCSRSFRATRLSVYSML